MVHLRIHVFTDCKDRVKVWLNLMPCGMGMLPPAINMFTALESFPVVSYPMKGHDGKETHARLFPPADPGKNYGVMTLGLVNSLAVVAIVAAPAVTVDPAQLVRSVRYAFGSTG